MLTIWWFFLFLLQWGREHFSLLATAWSAVLSPKASLAVAVAPTRHPPNPYLHEDVEQPLHYPNISEERPQPSAEQSNLDYKSLRLLKHSRQTHLWLRAWPRWIALRETFLAHAPFLPSQPALLPIKQLSLNTLRIPLQDFKAQVSQDSLPIARRCTAHWKGMEQPHCQIHLFSPIGNP